MGAGGRDFHDFNVLYRNDPETEVVAFTATQIPGIAGRTYPPSLAGPRYPAGIPIVAEEELAALVRERRVDEVVFAYSDVSYHGRDAPGGDRPGRRRRLHAAGPGFDDDRECEAGGRRLRRPHRQRQEPDQPRGRPDPRSTPDCDQR